MLRPDEWINDADNHFYEPDDCFTRHIEAPLKKRTAWIDRTSAGPSRMYVGDERCHFFSVGAGDSIGGPGIMKAFLRGETEDGGSPSLSPIDGLSVPEFTQRNARLAKLDEQRGDAPVDRDLASARREGAADQLQQGRLAGAVATDDADGLAAADVQV